jgi:hypothetical protein
MRQLWDKTIDVWRLTDDSPADSEGYTLHLSNIPCNIQPFEDTYGTDLEGAYGKDFLMFCPLLDINHHDKIIDGTDEYLVTGVEGYELSGFSHLELRIRKQK